MSPYDKQLVWLHGEIKTPPFSKQARLETGYLLRKLQRGEILSLPRSRPMSSIGAHCHELRINDLGVSWRVVYRIDSDSIVIVEVFAKKTKQTSTQVIDACKKRLTKYDQLIFTEVTDQ
jgi:phage-related protein